MLRGRIGVWTWVLIFSGMLVMAVGLTVQENDAVLGWLLCASSALAIVVGIVLIWVRSKMRNQP